MSTSASALKVCTPNCHYLMLYETLHRINKRATPEKMPSYKHALLLYKINNDQTFNVGWIEINSNKILTEE